MSKVFLHQGETWLLIGPFRNRMVAAMVPQALSSDCISLGASTAPRLPSSMAGTLLPFVWKGGTQTRAGLQSRGLANTDQRHRVVPRDKRILLVTLLTFSKYFPTFLENTQNKCYPMGLVAIFSRQKSTCIGQQPNACLLCGEDMPTVQKGAGTSIGRLVLSPRAPSCSWKFMEKCGHH